MQQPYFDYLNVLHKKTIIFTEKKLKFICNICNIV